MRVLLFIFAISIITILIAGAHWLVYFAIQRFFILNSTSLKYLRIAFVILALSFVVTSIVTMLGYSRIGSFFYAASAVWLGTVYWLFLASFLGLLLLRIWDAINPHTAFPHLIGQLLLVIGLCVSGYGLIHAEDTKIVRYEAKLPNLNESWRGKKIVLVADTHLGNVRNVGFSRKIASLVSAEKPEAVLIAGDFFDGPPVNAAEVIAPWKEIHAPKGIYFTNGNHEEFEGKDKFHAPLREAGIFVFSDSLKEVDGLQIVGVNFFDTEGEKINAETLSKINLDPNKPSILIKHSPTGINATMNKGIDLQVSGHTHRGQVWPGPWLTKRIFGPFSYGSNQLGDLQVITTSGAGTWGPPQRVGTQGEIVVITLTNK